MVRMEETAEDSLAAIRARSKFGMAIAAMIKMIATTISSSMSEKPACLRKVLSSYVVGLEAPRLPEHVTQSCSLAGSPSSYVGHGAEVTRVRKSCITAVRGRKPKRCAKSKRAANSRSLLPACTLPQVLRQTVAYWLSGLKVRMPASVLAHTPAGSTRTTASSSAQKARIPVWLIVIGTATTV